MKISIVIPVYNKAAYIDGCMECLLQQDFDSFEVICVCDGSTDNSGEICDQWAGKDQRIRVIHKDNGGVTAARRRGVEEAQGQYVMFVDADDKLLPGALKTMYQAIEQSQADEVIATFTTHEGVASPVVYQGFTPVEPLIKAHIGYIVSAVNYGYVVLRECVLNEFLQNSGAAYGLGACLDHSCISSRDACSQHAE